MIVKLRKSSENLAEICQAQMNGAVKIRPREHVRDDAGHSSGSITDKYIDVELRERHSSARRKRIKPDFIEDH